MSEYRKFPYLVIETFHAARPDVRTEKKGWGNFQDNWSTNESPSLVYRISERNSRQASVIIDLVNKKLIKNRYTNTAPDDVIKHYFSKHAANISQAIALFEMQKAIHEAEQKQKQAA